MQMENSITDKRKKNCIEFFIRHPKYFVEIISKIYPFNKSQLRIYKTNLNWELISQNHNIKWSTDIISEFKNQIFWDIFSANKSAFSDLNHLDTYSHLIDWYGNEDHGGDSIASNIGLPWSEDFIDKYQDKINFEKLSSNQTVPWTEKLLEKYRGKWDLTELGENKSIPWTLKLFDKYLSEEYLDKFFIKRNPKIISNVDLIEKYKSSLDWSCISSNQFLPWVEQDLLNRWKNDIDWWGICQNEFLFQYDKDFFKNHMGLWTSNNYHYFKSLSSNKVLPWSIPFLDTYKEYLEWEEICLNEGIPWSQNLLNYFEKKLLWGGFRDCPLENQYGEIVSMTGGKTVIWGLFLNKALPWSIEFLEYFEKKIDVDALEVNSAVWDKSFRYLVDDTMIETIMKRLNN